LRAEDTAVYYC
nr:immunoglobulin heavy chain junction region [Homo sapiens]